VLCKALEQKNHIEKFRGTLVAGHAYYLHYLDVKHGMDTFRVVDHC
jgi:hypothetical protein